MKRLFIANRGEVASRVARTARALGISTVGIYSEPDAHLPYLNDLDEAIALSGVTATETYLDVSKVVNAATSTDCDALHPGYGFLAENPEFADAVVAAGLIYVGPPAECIAAMGSKVRAKELARKCSVPVLPDAVVTKRHELAELAAQVGYPLLVKASAGGGGRGIRLVASEGDLAQSVDAVRREAEASFGDDTIFLERFLAGPRHVEIQIFGDTHGNLVHLGDRECSVQRRHQKLIEECPAAMVGATLRAEMAAAAVRLGEEIGYVSAGTCEFLVQNDQFYFLEMNTRLQVEHTVTEQVTGLDLVALQLAVAEGEPLPFVQSEVVLAGHAIQARVCAEDPFAGWLPSSGQVHNYHHADDGARYENGIETGSDISPHYDSMITKVIATGSTRAAAIATLSGALRGITLHGPSTNIATLVRVLADEDFQTGSVSVNWLEDHPELTAPVDALPAAVVAAAVVSAVEATGGSGTLPAAWSNTARLPVHWTVIDQCSDIHDIRYLPPLSPGAYFPTFDIDGVQFVVRHLRHTGAAAARPVRVEVDGRAEVLSVAADAAIGADAGCAVWVNGPRGQVRFDIAPRFAEVGTGITVGGPISPMPGTVLDIMVEPGQAVYPGDPLVVVEAMKMEHVVKAAADAIVSRVLVQVGQAVDAGRILVEFETVK